MLLVGAAGYVGINVGRIYFRFYAYQDQMKQAARFAGELSDSAIQSRLAFSADSLGLPAAAHRISVARSGRTIAISADYIEVVDLRFWSRQLRFRPAVIASF
jgi:hypothetical protein